MNAFDITPEQIREWSETTQAVAELGTAHFDLFNSIQALPYRSRARQKAEKALGTLYRAAEYLRSVEEKEQVADWLHTYSVFCD